MRKRVALLNRRKQLTIDILIAKHANPSLPMSVVLERAGLTPYYYYNELLNPERLTTDSPQKKRSIDSILNGPESRAASFRMNLSLLKQQYVNVHTQKAKKYVEGTFENPQNVEDLVYLAMIFHKPVLHSNDRQAVMGVLTFLKPIMTRYLRESGVERIIRTYRKQTGPLKNSILELFDNARKRIKKDDSLFDLNSKRHLHLWEFWHGPSEHYLKDPDRAGKAAYHTLTEENPKFKLRPGAISEFKKLEHVSRHFTRLKLRKLMRLGFKGKYKDSPLPVILAFDRGYQDATKDTSLFDQKQEQHLHLWNFRTPQGYWSEIKNKREAVYHVLTEHDARLASKDKTIASSALNGISGFKELFADSGLAGLMMRLGNSVYEMLKLYDSQRKVLGYTGILDGWKGK